jgi:predicted nucleic acid-binding Zn finger protein
MKIYKVNDEEYKVESSSKKGIFHIVNDINGVWNCDCEAFKFRKDDKYPCKHIISVKMKLRSNVFNDIK